MFAVVHRSHDSSLEERHGHVTANITNLPWDVALKEIMNANGYDVTINPDGVIVIDTFENIAARQATIPLRNAHHPPQLRARQGRRADGGRASHARLPHHRRDGHAGRPAAPGQPARIP